MAEKKHALLIFTKPPLPGLVNGRVTLAESAAGAGATLLLVEAVVPADNSAPVVKLVDMEMLLINDGRERTADEYQRLLEAGGFEMTRVVPTESRFSIIEARAT